MLVSMSCCRRPFPVFIYTITTKVASVVPFLDSTIITLLFGSLSDFTSRSLQTNHVWILTWNPGGGPCPTTSSSTLVDLILIPSLAPIGVSARVDGMVRSRFVITTPFPVPYFTLLTTSTGHKITLHTSVLEYFRLSTDLTPSSGSDIFRASWAHRQSQSCTYLTHTYLT